MDRLKEFAGLIAWFDAMACGQEWQSGTSWFPGAQGNYKKSTRTADANVTIHWLCYIADRQSDVKAIWTKGVDAFAGLVDTLVDCGDESRELVVKMGQVEIPPKTSNWAHSRTGEATEESSETQSRKMRRFRCGYWEEDEEVGFTPRFPIDKYLAVRTLCLLKPHRLSLVRFLRYVYETWKERNIRLGEDSAKDFVAKVSFAAYLLSYKEPLGKCDYHLVYELSQAPRELAHRIKSYADWLSALVENGDVKTEFEGWRCKKARRKSKEKLNDRPGVMYSNKRLWCALRDDFRSQGFWDAWGRGFPLDKKSLMPNLEITADLWNERFRKWAIEPWAGEALGREVESVSAWEIRQLYSLLWREKDFAAEAYFPMQTDIAFSFAPRMCSESTTNPAICKNWCPFGEFNDGSRLCIGDTLGERETKYCPLVLHTCGYVAICRPTDCFIRRRRLARGGTDLAICEGPRKSERHGEHTTGSVGCTPNHELTKPDTTDWSNSCPGCSTSGSSKPPEKFLMASKCGHEEEHDEG